MKISGKILLYFTVSFGLCFAFCLNNKFIKAYSTELALPRFVSVKSSKMNTRSGPGFEWPVIWHYWRKNMPVEIIEEYDQWRKIRDVDGDVSWVFRSLLSGNRTVIIRKNNLSNGQFLALFSDPNFTSSVVAKVQAGAIARLDQCDGDWCHISFDNSSGYIPQGELWGVYKKEVIK